MDVAPLFTTGQGVPFRWVCDLRRVVVKPREFTEGHLGGHPETGLQDGRELCLAERGRLDQERAWRTRPGIEVDVEAQDIEPSEIAG